MSEPHPRPRPVPFAHDAVPLLLAAAARTTLAIIRSALALPGAPQVLLQFGVARTARPTARRPAADLL